MENKFVKPLQEGQVRGNTKGNIKLPSSSQVAAPPPQKPPTPKSSR